MVFSVKEKERERERKRRGRIESKRNRQPVPRCEIYGSGKVNARVQPGVANRRGWLNQHARLTTNSLLCIGSSYDYLHTYPIYTFRINLRMLFRLPKSGRWKWRTEKKHADLKDPVFVYLQFFFSRSRFFQIQKLLNKDSLKCRKVLIKLFFKTH